MIRKIAIILLLLALIGGFLAYMGYDAIFSENTAFSDDEYTLYIPSGSNYADVKHQLKEENIVADISSFDKVAGWMKYNKEKVPSGRYIFRKGWSNKTMISMLRSGNQSPVNITFNNVRSISQLAGEVSKNLEIDSVSLSNYLNSAASFEKAGYNAENFLSAFIPNTYNMFWDVSKEDLVDRLLKEREKFWDKNNRRQKAEALGMTVEEVYTLASIVEKESQHGPERPTIAGLYMNRLKRGIPLQADPTVVFATGQFDLRRVLKKHLEVDSPYNTYKYEGLPPGPIFMPSIQSIDAVLNHEKHDYLYMCAKPGFGTQHAFAKTLRGHNENANKYRRWLDQQGIR